MRTIWRARLKHVRSLSEAYLKHIWRWHLRITSKLQILKHIWGPSEDISEESTSEDHLRTIWGPSEDHIWSTQKQIGQSAYLSDVIGGVLLWVGLGRHGTATSSRVRGLLLVIHFGRWIDGQLDELGRSVTIKKFKRGSRLRIRFDVRRCTHSAPDGQSKPVRMAITWISQWKRSSGTETDLGCFRLSVGH